jgi:hypothetical protein
VGVIQGIISQLQGIKGRGNYLFVTMGNWSNKQKNEANTRSTLMRDDLLGGVLLEYLPKN